MYSCDHCGKKDLEYLTPDNGVRETNIYGFLIHQFMCRDCGHITGFCPSQKPRSAVIGQIASLAYQVAFFHSDETHWMMNQCWVTYPPGAGDNERKDLLRAALAKNVPTWISFKTDFDDLLSAPK